MPVRSCTQFRKTGAIAVMQVRQVHAMSVCFVTVRYCLQFRDSDVIQGCAGGETGDTDIHDILHVKAERSETGVCQKADVGKKRKVWIPTGLTKNKWVSTAPWWLKVLYSQPFGVWLHMFHMHSFFSMSEGHVKWRLSFLIPAHVTIYNLYLFTLEEMSAYTTCPRSFRLLGISSLLTP